MLNLFSNNKSYDDIKQAFQEKGIFKDNFGNVYDLKNQTINGVKCNFVIKTDGLDERKLFLYVYNLSGKMKIYINNRGLSSEGYFQEIYVNKENFNLERLRGFGSQSGKYNQDISIEETINGKKTTKLIEPEELSINFIFLIFLEEVC